MEGWNAGLRDCQDVRIHNLYINSGGSQLFTAGLQFAGGKNIVVTGCVIFCGDDCVAFVNSPFQQTTPLTDATVSNCVLRSQSANALRVQVTPPMTGTVHPIARISVSNIVAKCGPGDTVNAGGITIQDQSGGATDLITDVNVDNFYLDAIDSNQGLLIDRAQRVTLSRVTIVKPRLHCRIDRAIDVELRDCVVDTPDQAGENCLTVGATANCSNIRILGGRYLGSKQHGIQLGSADHTVGPAEVSHVWIRGATNNGLLLWNAAITMVIGNSIIGCGGWGIQEFGAQSDFNLFLGNQLIGNGSGQLSLVGAASTEAIRNVVAATVALPDTGGFRQTIEGWSLNGLGAGTAVTELTRFNLAGIAYRFRAVRKGSITGVGVTSTGNVTAGTLSVEVFKNTGAAGAAMNAATMSTGLKATLNSTAPTNQRAFTTQGKDSDTFDPGDELFIVVTTDAAFLPTGTLGIKAVLEIED